jgi:DNA-binding NarL/FixJ family response regulator
MDSVPFALRSTLLINKCTNMCLLVRLSVVPILHSAKTHAVSVDTAPHHDVDAEQEGRIPPMAEAAIQVLVVHECPLVCASFRHLLESQPDLVVVGEVPPGAEAVEFAQSQSADVVLFDPIRQGDSCLELIPALGDTLGHPRVVVLLRVPDPEFARHAVELGARGVVNHDLAPAGLFKALRTVHAGEVWLSRDLIARVLLHRSARPPEDPEQQKIARLTPREREVIALIGAGLDSRQIAAQLAISETTVRHHLTAIFTKLGVHDRLKLVVYAYRHGLAVPPS